jgi:hypothetical protein
VCVWPKWPMHCNTYINQDKPGTVKTPDPIPTSIYMWNRLAPYVLKLYGRHGQSPEKEQENEKKSVSALD